MLQSLFSLLPGGRGGDKPRRSRRGARSKPPEQIGEQLGKWIWLPDAESGSVRYLQARKVFELAAAPDTATIRASAQGRYKLYVNGVHAGRGPVPGGRGFVYYDTHDIAHLLQKGRNVIAFLVHSPAAECRKSGLICKAEVDVGGHAVSVESDETWTVRAATEWADVQDGSFDFEARILPLDWNEIKCREREWREAAVVGECGAPPWGSLVARQIPLLAEHTVPPCAVVGIYNSPPPSPDAADRVSASLELSPLRSGDVKDSDSLVSGEGIAQVRTPRGNQGVAVVLDFGRAVSGEVEIAIAGSGRAVVTLSYLDHFEDGHVPSPPHDDRTDRILLDRGKLVWQGLGARTFRFLVLGFREGARPISIDHVRVIENTYPVELSGEFECSDRILNDVWGLGVDTTRLCMGDTYLDSPAGNHMSWTAARTASRVAYYAFGDAALLSQSLRQIASTQRDDGAVSGSYPTDDCDLVPDAALFWVFSILDGFAFSGDVAILQELYPSARRLMDWFSRFVTDDGLLSNVPGSIFIDNADVERRGSLTALNCLYYQALQVAGMIAGVTGHEEDAARLMESASALKLAINKHLFVPKRGLYAEGRLHGKLVEKFSRQANILAVLFDIPDHYRKATIFRLLAGSTLPEIETPYFASHYLEALYAGERHDEALSYIRRKWGPMAKSGDGTAWELFTGEGMPAYAGSVCPARDLVAEYVGIKPIPGSHRYAIAPHTGDLEWARGSVATPMGPLTVAWRTTRNSITVNLTVPEGLRVDVYPPCGPDARVTVDGRHWPSRLATLGHGEHVVRATAPRPTKPQAIDESVAPAEIPHVEIIGGMVPLGRRRVSTREGRPRRRGRERDEETAAPLIDTAPPAEAEVEEQTPATVETHAASDVHERKSRRPRRRRRSRSGEAPEPVGEAGAPTETEVIEPQVVETEMQAAAEVQERRSRRPRRRRRGRSEQPTESAPEIEVLSEQPIEPAEVEQTPEATAEAPVKKPRRSRRRPRRTSEGQDAAQPEGDAGHAVAEQTHEPAPPPEQPQETSQPAAEGDSEQKPARRRRRSYRRRRPAEPPATE